MWGIIAEVSKLEKQGNKNNADAVLQISANINKTIFEKIRGEKDMCEALRELMADDLKQAEKQGLEQGIFGTVDILRGMNVDDSTIIKRLSEQYKISEDKAKKYLYCRAVAGWQRVRTENCPEPVPYSL